MLDDTLGLGSHSHAGCLLSLVALSLPNCASLCSLFFLLPLLLGTWQYGCPIDAHLGR